MKKKYPKADPSKPDLRSRQCSFFLVEQDARELASFAKRLGFTSTAQLTTAIMERLMLGGFSPAVFFKVGMQIRDFAEDSGATFGGSFYFGLRPLPSLPEQHISEASLKKEIAALRRDLLKPDATTNTEK